jgi:hypothetical protein
LCTSRTGRARWTSCGRIDKRGSGASDPVPLGALPTLEELSDDIRTVMDAVESARAAILGALDFSGVDQGSLAPTLLLPRFRPF